MSPSSSSGTLAWGAFQALAAAAIVLASSAAAAAPSGRPAATASPPPIVVAPVHIHGMTYDRARHSLVLTITGQVTISTRVLKGPPRLVVDIPASSLDSANRELVIKDELIARVRVSQFKIFPPSVRVVIETATEQEPLIAVQQTGRRLYITLAPARGGAEDMQPSGGLLPSPGPEPSDFTPPTIAETPLPTLAPTSAPGRSPAPRWVPTAIPTLLRPAATPVPTPRPGGIQTRLRPGRPLPTPGRPAATPTPLPDTLPPGSEWRDLFPQTTPAPRTSRQPLPAATPWRPTATPSAPPNRPPVAPTATPFRPPVLPTPGAMATPRAGNPQSPFGSPFIPDGEPTPIPPPRTPIEESGSETLPAMP